MHDIRLIRKHPDSFDKAMMRRGLAPIAETILARDKDVREDKTALQQLQQQLNSYAKKIGEYKSQGKDATEWIEKSKLIKQAIAAKKESPLSSHDDDISTALVDNLLFTLPNILDKDVPDGASSDENKEVKRWGKLPHFDFSPQEHDILGEHLGSMDFSQTAKISGSRFVTLSGQLAALHRALAHFMLDIHTREFGFTEVAPPLLVKKEALYGSGQLPKFADDAFVTTSDLWLVPTSEVSLINLVRESIIPVEHLPLRYVAYTPCFRSEAGAAGRDTRGMIRQHQFWKVELVSIADPERSEQEHLDIVQAAETILQRLELPYRVMLLCAGDTGFSAKKTYDLEVWLPGQSTYREISSCSHCGDFQARRMAARYRTQHNEIGWLHTLNGSGLAVGRTLIAVMENYQNRDGSITVPHALRPYMNGVEQITPPS